MKKFNQQKKQKGFGLVEILIAIGLGVIVSAGLVQLFSINKSSFRLQDGMARMQENARFAHYYLAREIRMSGYDGCGGLQNVQPTIQANPPASGVNLSFDVKQVITGHEATGPTSWSPALPANVAGNPAANTDVIILKSAETESVKLTSPMVQPNTAVLVSNRLNIQQGDVVMITDCEKADVFNVTNAAQSTVLSHGSAGNASPNLSKAYQTDAFLMRFKVSAFYIKDTGRVSNSGAPIRALYMQDVDGVEQELVEGVEDMQLTYGVDTTGDNVADSVQTAAQINAADNWDKVLSVNVSLLVNTVDEVSQTSQAYTFNGTTVNSPGDRLLRRQWDSYITLRNRSL